MDNNVYYNPESWGLSVVAEIEYSDQNYVFDTRIVWKDSDGILYTARDAGCSCPTPFEDYNDLASLERVDLKELEREIAGQLSNEYGCHITAATGRDFIRKVESTTQECPRCGSAPLLERDYVCESCRFGV